ncbi:MAG: VOC family protein [Xanthomonadales bacterium]|jgi:predicted enzyme related to lactoylglutathione lyase|nr:VOC family protein [Xanthomonadales bacterium]
MDLLKRTTFIVEDADAAARFYETVFGWRRWYDQQLVADRRFPPTGSDEDSAVHLVILETSDPVIGKLGFLQYLDPPFEAMTPAPRDRVRPGEPILVVATKDVDGVHERAVAAGASVVTPPVDWTVPAPNGASRIHLRSVSLFDPNGIYLEVSAHPQTD